MKQNKIERFLLCQNPKSDGTQYVLCTRPVCLFKLPEMELIFGEEDDKLKERARDWYIHAAK